MFVADTHMHSTVSFDAHNTRREMAEAAQQAGLSCICFTDHYDVIDEKGNYCLSYDWMPARQAQAEAKKAVSGDFSLLYGLELGNAPANFAAAEKVLAEPGLDCVIGSIHNTTMELGGQDYYSVDYSAHPEICGLHLEDYLRQMLELVQWGNYDTLGHLPYPLRYMRDQYGLDVSLAPYSDQVETILRTMVETGKALEVNTNRARTPLDDYVPLLKTFRSMGGELVTVGADAHQREHVGLGVETAYDLLRTCGFRYVTVFRNRQPDCIKL